MSSPGLREFDVGGFSFDSKQDALKWLGDMLRDYQPGEIVSDEDGQLLLAILKRHPEAGEKIGCGVKFFTVEKSYINAKCFYVNRTDGSKTDFSYRRCIAGSPKSAAHIFREAARTAVRPFMNAFKTRHFENHRDAMGRIICALSAQMLSFEETQVDHAPPWTFEAIVAAFIKERGLRDLGQYVTLGADMQWVRRFTDAAMEEDFLTFHDARAKLRCIDGKLNSAMGQVKG